jgi:flagellar biosynthesis GTPase FlhF
MDYESCVTQFQENERIRQPVLLSEQKAKESFENTFAQFSTIAETVDGTLTHEREVLKTLHKEMKITKERLESKTVLAETRLELEHEKARLQKRIRRQEKEMARLQSAAFSDLRKLRLELSELRSRARRNENISASEFGQAMARVKDSAQHFRPIDKECGKSQGAVSRLCKKVVESLVEWQKRRTLARELPAPLEAPRYRVGLNGAELASRMDRCRNEVTRGLRKIGRQGVTAPLLRNFARQHHKVLRDADDLLSVEAVARTLGVDLSRRYRMLGEEDRVNARIHELFDAGVNLLVLGEAGAGKTTTLQVHAEKRLLDQDEGEITLFVPLASLSTVWSSGATARHGRSDTHLAVAIAAYLQSLGIPVSGDELTRSWQKQKWVLLLDGIDETLNSAPWIVKSIREASNRFDRLQVIASCRTGRELLHELPFLCVTLLPFTEQQRKRFVRRWFDGAAASEARNIDRHLGRHPDLAKVVSSPLLATVLCVLAEHGMSLPRNEIALYEERAKLLLGRYDAYKGIHRLKSREDDLDAMCRRLATEMHNRGLRQIDRGLMDEIATKHFGREIGDRAAVAMVEELIYPCNILVPMTEDGKLGFGHLRFQEYFAAREIWADRSIDVLPLLASEWWRGVFVLLAQMWESLDWVFENLSYEIQIRDSAETIRAMIERRPAYERELLQGQLEAWLEIETVRKRQDEFWE